MDKYSHPTLLLPIVGCVFLVSAGAVIGGTIRETPMESGMHLDSADWNLPVECRQSAPDARDDRLDALCKSAAISEP